MDNGKVGGKFIQSDINKVNLLAKEYSEKYCIGSDCLKEKVQLDLYLLLEEKDFEKVLYCQKLDKNGDNKFIKTVLYNFLELPKNVVNSIFSY